MLRGMSDAATLPCARCGYDLRATPADGVCPECGEMVAEAVRVAAIPVRPAWADSDPRWRRRMLAGVWVLTLMPLLPVLQASGLAESVPLPLPFDYYNTVTAVDHTLLVMLYPWLGFCTGVVLLFARERHRRAGRLDWTRRWGVIGSYVVLLLGFSTFTLLLGLVSIGIAALFLTLPPDNQPPVTDLMIALETGLIYYAPQASDVAVTVLAASSAFLMLLACAPLYAALRSSGLRRLAVVPLATLAAIALFQVGSATWFAFNRPVSFNLQAPPGFFFQPAALVGYAASLLTGSSTWWTPWFAAGEAAKWLAITTTALWLTGAQVRSWRRRPPAAGAASAVG